MKLILLASLLLWPQQPCQQSWHFEPIGVQMPKDAKPITSLVFYFKPTPDSRPPICVIDIGEAQFSTVNAGYLVLNGKQNTRVDFHCSLRTP